MSILNFLHSGGNKVTLSAPDSNPASDLTFKLPQADGSSGQVLSTNGSGALSFVNSQNNYPVFFARNNNNQSIPNSTSTKIQFDYEVFDSHGYYDHSTNYRFTPQIAGYYYITANIYYTNINNVYAIDIKKNGSRWVNLDYYTTTQGTRSAFISSLVPFNGSSDYVEVFGYHTSGGSRTIGNGQQYSINEFSGHFVRALV